MLRPLFTRSLATGLLAGNSFVMVSPHGRGRRQTVVDLRTLLAGRVFTIHLNMRDYCNDFKGLLNDAMRQIGGTQKTPGSWSQFLDGIEKLADQSLLILHNFDEIRHPTAVACGYSISFFDALNSIEERCAISLLCVCENSHEAYLIDQEHRPIQGSSLLTASVVELPETDISASLKSTLP